MESSRQILLVENDDDNAKVIELTLIDAHITNRLIRKVDSESALVYLQNEDNPRTCIILLDLNLPQMQAFEFLKIVNANDYIKHIPVLVLVSSDDDQVVAERFGLGISGFIEKPFNCSKFIEAVRALDIHWTLSGSEDESE